MSPAICGTNMLLQDTNGKNKKKKKKKIRMERNPCTCNLVVSRKLTSTGGKRKSYPLLKKKVFLVKNNTQFQFCGFKLLLF